MPFLPFCWDLHMKSSCFEFICKCIWISIGLSLTELHLEIHWFRWKISESMGEFSCDFDCGFSAKKNSWIANIQIFSVEQKEDEKKSHKNVNTWSIIFQTKIMPISVFFLLENLVGKKIPQMFLWFQIHCDCPISGAVICWVVKCLKLFNGWMYE